MTTPTTTPGRLYHLLALYAALDQEVTDSGDPSVAAVVERYLPGTTGEGQRGWSANLADFLGGELPDATTALRTFAEGPELTPPQLSRLVYIVGSLAHLQNRLDGQEDLFADVLGLARPSGGRPDIDVEGGDPGRELLALLRERFDRRQDWEAVTSYAVLNGWLDETVAEIPLCNACLTMQDGVECVVVDTYFEHETITYEQVIAILDPRNWDETAGECFCNMTDLGPCSPPNTGWGRVLETVGVWCGSGLPTLVTDLRYHKASYPQQHKAVMQYDLDHPFPGWGDGQVTVDKGWLKVTRGTSTNPHGGVTVATKKVVHIKPLWPVAQKIFVCALGYGHAAMEMLFGHAQNPPEHPVKWEDPPGPAVPDPPPGQADTPPAQSMPTPTTAAGLAVSMLSECLAEVARESSDFAAKCAGPQLTVDDLATFSAKMGARIASEPWRFIQRLAELPPPPTHPTPNPAQGGEL